MGEEGVNNMKEKIAQRQKNTKDVKTSYILEELDRKFGIMDTNDMGVVT
ncbi:hypothetical protein LCGC14_2789880 [marine sediment metagenome]|uniref:Uncharacterized protein n=1 Tax=marine sediment metagenome TaxID=412755 RepID=A0A0F8YQS2_9ZZZZ